MCIFGEYIIQMIQRILKEILSERLFKGKTIVLIGPRQVGKTTLLKKVIQQCKKPSTWLNADEADILEIFSSAATSTQLLRLIGPESKLVVIDEAQQIPHIGKKLNTDFHV